MKQLVYICLFTLITITVGCDFKEDIKIGEDDFEKVSFSLDSDENGNLRNCEDEDCETHLNPANCAVLEITFDSSTEETCEKCLDTNSQIIYERCDNNSVICDLITTPEPDCIVCSYIDGNIIYSNCTADVAEDTNIEFSNSCNSNEDCIPGMQCLNGQCEFIVQVEICDGIDNDLDGEIDEEVCNEGVINCTSNLDCGENGTCDVATGNCMSQEICDGIDNDLDGIIDENVCDEGVIPCNSDLDCPINNTCTAGVCIEQQNIDTSICLTPAIELNFGDVEIGTSKTVNFEISNCGTGDLDLTIESIVFSANTSVEYTFSTEESLPCSLSLEQSISVEITYTPTTNTEFSRGQIVVSSNDPAKPVIALNLYANRDYSNSDDLRIELRWEHPEADLDLHLVKPEGVIYEATDDCYYANPSPEWGEPGDDDNPLLAIDDVLGYGPEVITYKKPYSGKFTIYSHFFGDISESESYNIPVNVKIYIKDVFIAQFNQTLTNEKQLWTVATIDWPEDLATESPEIEEVNDISIFESDERI